MFGARTHTLVTVFTLSSACGHADPAVEDGSQTDTSGSATSESAGESESGDDGDLPPEICNDPFLKGPGDGPLFVEVTNEIGFAVTDDFEPLATGVVAGDLDGDGWEDLIAALFPAQRETPDSPRYRFVFMNRPGENGERIFVDETDASGIFALGDLDMGNRRGLSVFSLGDLDSDGDLDVVGCPGSGELDPPVIDPCMALLNDGSGTFEPVTEGELSSEVFWVPSSALLDYDRDGVLDFWPGTVGQWAYGPALVSRPRLYRGAGDGSFTEVGESVGLPQTLTDPGGYRINFGVTSCDLNRDGWPEVLLADYYMQPNFAWSFDGTQFNNVAAAIGVEDGGIGGHTFSIACGDVDDDDDTDLMTAEVHHPGVAGDISGLLLNPGSGAGWETFDRVDLASAGLYRDEGWMEGDNMPIFVDVDSDGYKDIFMASSNYPQQFEGDPDWTHAWLWRRIPGGVFEDITSETPWSEAGHESGEGPVWVDFDHDGDLDLVIGTGAFNGQLLGLKNTLRAYRNDIVTNPNWTAIRLHGAGPGAANASAIGARVTVRAGELVMHQEQLGSWGHSNTQNEWLTFGLGEACEIDEIEVIWPDGEQTVSLFEAVRGNYRIELFQGSDDVEYRID